jgi:hypothetical protein
MAQAGDRIGFYLAPTVLSKPRKPVKLSWRLIVRESYGITEMSIAKMSMTPG